MSKSTHLFEIIKTLNKAEKRHFKLFAQKYTKVDDTKYILLFNIIEKQKKYSERKLKIELKNEKFNIKNISSDKNYLYNLILDSLVFLHRSKDSYSIVKQNIAKSEMLLSKGLKQEGLQLLQKTKNIALKQDYHINLLEMFRIERDMAARDYFSTDRKKMLNDIENQENHVLSLFKNEQQFRQLSGKLYNLISKYVRPRTQEELDALEEIVKHPLLKNEEQAQTIVARIYYYNIMSTYYYIIYDYDKAFELSGKLIEWFDKHKNAKKEQAMRYVVTFRNYTFYACRNKHPNALNYWKKFISFKSQYNLFPNQAIKYVTEQSPYLCMMLYKSINDFENAEKHGLEYIKKIKINPNKVETNLRLSVLSNMTSLYMNHNRFDEAHEINNLIINDPDIIKKPGLFSIAKVINLIIHYEKQNFNLLEYLIRSTYIYLLKRDHLHGFEKTCISFMKKLMKGGNNNESLKTLFEELYKEMEILSENQFEKVFFEYFNVLEWLKRQIKQVSLKEKG